MKRLCDELNEIIQPKPVNLEKFSKKSLLWSAIYDFFRNAAESKAYSDIHDGISINFVISNDNDLSERNTISTNFGTEIPMNFTKQEFLDCIPIAEAHGLRVEGPKCDDTIFEGCILLSFYFTPSNN